LICAAVDQALRRMGHDVIGMEQYVAEGMTPLARSVAQQPTETLDHRTAV
jgi:hypothetical protein